MEVIGTTGSTRPEASTAVWKDQRPPKSNLMRKTHRRSSASQDVMSIDIVRVKAVMMFDPNNDLASRYGSTDNPTLQLTAPILAGITSLRKIRYTDTMGVEDELRALCCHCGHGFEAHLPVRRDGCVQSGCPGRASLISLGCCDVDDATSLDCAWLCNQYQRHHHKRPGTIIRTLSGINASLPSSPRSTILVDERE